MFKKLISNLPFSPSLVGQLGFYVRRLRKEETTRRAGLILTALALILQGFITFAPAETQAASSNNDIIYGGFTDKADLLRIYDKGKDSAGRADIAQIYNYFGVTRKDIEDTYLGRINSKDFNSGIYSTGRYSYGNLKGADEQAKKITGTNTTVYMRKLRAFDAGHQLETGNGYAALIGKRSVDGKWFAIVLACGNMDFTTLPPAPKPTTPTTPTKPVTPTTPTTPTTPSKPTTPTTPVCTYNNAILSTSSDCKPCAGDTSLWYKDTNCASNFTTAKTVSNMTTSVADADKTSANAGDRLQYTLSVKNTGKAAGTYTISDTVGDVLEYADLVDNGGGTLGSVGGTQNTNPDTISWPTVTIAPGDTAIQRFIVQVKDQIPATPTNISNPESYNCEITNSFGQTTNVMINCPAPKQVEQVVTDLPSTGPTENMIVAGIAFAVVAYFYARSRQLGREVRLIRRDFNSGTF